MDDQPVCDEMAKFAPLGSFLGGNTQAVQAHTSLDKAYCAPLNGIGVKCPKGSDGTKFGMSLKNLSVAPLRRSRSGSITAVTKWLQYGSHGMAPICRSRSGSNTAVSDTWWTSATSLFPTDKKQISQ
jgi:hypothetical protein